VKKIIVTVAFLALAACHSSPYDGVNGKLETKPPSQNSGKPGGFTCNMPPALDVAEGTSQSLGLGCQVPSGTPVVTYQNLPSFVTPDASKPGTLNIAPQVGDGEDPSNPTVTVKRYDITVVLTSSDSSVAESTQDLAIYVHHQDGSVTVTGLDSQPDIYEGQTYTANITVSSPDFPQGPFYLSGVNMPAGATISSTSNPNQFTITYAPSFTTVRLGNSSTSSCSDPTNDNNVACIITNWTLNVTDPRGGLATTSTNWYVYDVRQNPIVVSPDSVSATLPEAQFYVEVEDPNGEVTPQVTAVTPDAGTVNVTAADKNAPAPSQLPYTMMYIDWSGLNKSSSGQQTLSIQSCVNGSDGTMSQCVTTPVNVTFK